METGVPAKDKLFGVEVRNVKRLRCGNYRHQSGDRECPLKDAIMPNEQSRLKRDDPLTAIIAHTDPTEPLKWELKQKPGISLIPRKILTQICPNKAEVGDLSEFIHLKVPNQINVIKLKGSTEDFLIHRKILQLRNTVEGATTRSFHLNKFAMLVIVEAGEEAKYIIRQKLLTIVEDTKADISIHEDHILLFLKFSKILGGDYEIDFRSRYHQNVMQSCCLRKAPK